MRTKRSKDQERLSKNKNCGERESKSTALGLEQSMEKGAGILEVTLRDTAGGGTRYIPVGGGLNIRREAGFFGALISKGRDAAVVVGDDGRLEREN